LSVFPSHGIFIEVKLARLMALGLALWCATLAVVPGPILHRCIWMKRPMATGHRCCPEYLATSTTPQAAPRLGRQCCELVAHAAHASNAVATRAYEGVEPPRIDAALRPWLAISGDGGYVHLPRFAAAVDRPPQPLTARSTTVLRI